MVLGASSKKKRANNDIDDETYSLVIKMAMGNPTSTNDFPINHPVYMYIYIYSYIIYIPDFSCHVGLPEGILKP